MPTKCRILLVEDSDITLEGLKDYLNQEYEVITASNGLEGLKAFEQNKDQLDLVITDLVMPLISGYGLITMLKKKSPSTPIIAMTAWGLQPKQLATEAKADMVLMKPFEMEDLDQSILRFLPRRL